ncbi:para-aminobenzoate synthase [Leucogyrophana mollusca]|uniref:Para-aminobenzoate synthase n=1 Tax=Leucogyrophana mollusca TaxID=85980 RepID=A0ACB8BNG7_9AGAM|nr:para-aminobenzoate synthase [Leucogyrophana mollusca]
MTPEPHKILLVDSYDSFTYNLASLCRRSIPGCAIYIIKNDQLPLPVLLPYLACFSAIIVGPGPGSPNVTEDIGLVRDLWKVSDQHLLPIFGVCLGLQSLAIESGARLRKLSVVKHGQVSRVKHTGTEIFKGVGDVDAVRYHSLHVELREHSNVEELACADDEGENGKVVMALKHKSRPFWAVQYHPESVLTGGGGIEVLINFWRLAQNWNKTQQRLIRMWDTEAHNLFGSPWPIIRPPPTSPCHNDRRLVSTTVLRLPNIPIPVICELFSVTDESSPFVLLDSAAQPGRYSIIGCLTAQSPQITHSIGDSFVHLKEGSSCSHIELQGHNIWSWLASFMNRRKASGGSPNSPFWGGLIGYLSYELGVQSLSVHPMPQADDPRHPDVNLVFVERSVVLDTTSGDVYIQSITEDDGEWIANTAAKLQTTAQEYSSSVTNDTPSSTKARPNTSTVTLPDRELYKSRINIAKEHLFSGDSYELCLTANTRITLNDPLAQKASRHHSPSWQRYKHLREVNPAPHAAYFRLHPTTLLASSPERFLSFSRPPNATYQLRPIKGTIRAGPGITRAFAENALRGSKKEVAENLMIVDLIRHDLHGVIGEDVEVKQFCGVEEYKTVWQLVSVIEGKPAEGAEDTDGRRANGALGWEVLRRSLPPGSMTGAPKKRSVEILQTLEDEERSLYSGVFGYWCVGGGGDWSVTIRSCFKYDGTYTCATHSASRQDVLPAVHKERTPEPEHWVIGAGGAITALSNADEEWEEMVVKLQSVLRVFGAAIPRGN